MMALDAPLVANSCKCAGFLVETRSLIPPFDAKDANACYCAGFFLGMSRLLQIPAIVQAFNGFSLLLA